MCFGAAISASAHAGQRFAESHIRYHKTLVQIHKRGFRQFGVAFHGAPYGKTSRRTLRSFYQEDCHLWKCPMRRFVGSHGRDFGVVTCIRGFAILENAPAVGSGIRLRVWVASRWRYLSWEVNRYSQCKDCRGRELVASSQAGT